MSSEVPCEPERQGLLFVVSAPSGTGKTTVVERLVSESVPNLTLSRSYTSRPVRRGEVDGVDYNFVSRQRFEEMIGAGAFLEFADVFGNYYGTSAVDTQSALDAGSDVILVIDVQGAKQVGKTGRPQVGVFMLPPSYEVLERRLRQRSKETEEQVQRRLTTARAEVTKFKHYDYVVVNEDLSTCVDQLRCIVWAERLRTVRAARTAGQIVQTFDRRVLYPEESSHG